MLQRTDRGKKFREYFIKCEEAWNTPEKIMERAWQILQQRVTEAENRIFGLTEENETLKIALDDSLSYCTVLKYSKMHDKHWPTAQRAVIGKKLTAYCHARAIEIRTCEDDGSKYGEVHSYPLTVWDDFMQYMYPWMLFNDKPKQKRKQG